MYQGRLSDGGSPANGNYDLRFTIYNAVTNGSAVSSILTNAPTVVSNGLFTVTLDFGPGIFTGLPRWLDIGVRTNGSPGAYTVLIPRQPLTPVPYAIFANTASNLSGILMTTQLVGTLPASAFAGYTNTVALTNSGNLFSGSFGGTFNGGFNGAFFGNGSGVTNVNVTNLTGVLADNQLPTNTAFVNSNQTFSGANTFTGTNFFAGANNFTNLYGNSFSGSFFGNGLVGWIPTNGTAIQAQIDHGYLLTNSLLVTITLPTSSQAGDIVRVSGAGASGWQVAQNAGQSIIGNFSSFSGSQWRLSSAPNPQNWNSIASSSDGSRLAATSYGSGGGIYISSDSGQTWTATNTILTALRAIASSADGSKMVAAVYGVGIYTNSSSVSGGWGIGGSTSGLNWISVASSSDGSKLVAAANGNGIYTSTNSGAIWKQQTSGLPSGSPNWYYVASSANGSNLVAVINNGGLYTSSNAGQSWSQQTAGLPSNPGWISVASSADGTKLAAAAVSAGIYTSANLGLNWVQQTNGAPANTNWASIASSADGSKLAAVVLGGGIYLSSNSGFTWAHVNAPTNNWYCVASSSDGSKLAAVVFGGGIYNSSASLAVTQSTTGTNGYITGPQGSAVELQYIGNNQWMPVSSAGAIWAF